jgi:hypothetical protein
MLHDSVGGLVFCTDRVCCFLLAALAVRICLLMRMLGAATTIRVSPPRLFSIFFKREARRCIRALRDKPRPPNPCSPCSSPAPHPLLPAHNSTVEPPPPHSYSSLFIASISLFILSREPHTIYSIIQPFLRPATIPELCKNLLSRGSSLHFPQIPPDPMGSHTHGMALAPVSVLGKLQLVTAWHCHTWKCILVEHRMITALDDNRLLLLPVDFLRRIMLDPAVTLGSRALSLSASLSPPHTH